MTAIAAGQLYIDGKVKRIIFSTGKTAGKDKSGKDYPTEAEAMHRFMHLFFNFRGQKIPETDVILETYSFDTAGNVVEVKRILDYHGLKKIALLTIGFHMFRSQKLFENYGIHITKVIHSESVLKNRDSKYHLLLNSYYWSIKYVRELIKELLALCLVMSVDPKGNGLRKITAVTRNRREGSK